MMEDIEEVRQRLGRWRKGPYLLALAAVLVFLGNEAIDGRWEASLTQTRCTVVSAKTEGEIRVSPGSRMTPARGRWVEYTTVEYQIAGGETRTSVQNGSEFPVGQVRDCWLTAEKVYLDPALERTVSRTDNIMLTGVMSVMALVWFLRTRSLPPFS